MANPRRGEVAIRLAGRDHVLRLTLNALAEIEAALDAGDLHGLGRRLAAGSLKATDLVALVGATLRGGGAAIDDAEVGALIEAADLPAVAEALAAVFALAFATEEAPGPPAARR